MAVDMFIEFAAADKIEGETKDKVKISKKAIDILAWSWGMSQSGSFHSGGGGGAGKANVQDLSFTKYVDKSTPALMIALLKGSHLTQATLTVRKAGDTPLEYIIITMKKLLVSSISTGGSGGEDRLTENSTLNFAEVEFSYSEQADKGAIQGAAKAIKWDIEKNAAPTA